MTRTAFDKIMTGAESALEIVEGRAALGSYKLHVPLDTDVRAIRSTTQLSQSGFAAKFGFSKAAVQDWEQGRRRPEAAARLLLTLIRLEPAAVERTLHQLGAPSAPPSGDARR